MHEFAAKIGEMNLDDVIDPGYEKLLCTPSPEDSDSNSDTNGGESNEQNGEKEGYRGATFNSHYFIH
jgi:hypothetical protein